MPRPYSSVAIAGSFLSMARREDRPLDPSSLQKLVYIAHGWNLALNDDPLCEEAAQAWDWGPVFPVLYDSVKRWGPTEISELWPEDYWATARPLTPLGLETDSNELELLKAVWSLYGSYSLTQLSILTHADKTPWAEVYAKLGRHASIPNDSIRSFYRELRDAVAPRDIGETVLHYVGRVREEEQKRRSYLAKPELVLEEQLQLLRERREELNHLVQERELRDRYSGRIFRLVSCWLLVVVLAIFLQGMSGGRFELAASTLNTLVGSTTLSVVSLVAIVAANLFPRRGGTMAALRRSRQ